VGEGEDALYVHLAADGGIFAVWGRTGEEAWITAETLDRELEELKERGGTLLYSRDAPDRDPPSIVERTFQRIADAEPPSLKLLDERHPRAGLSGGATTLMAAARAGDVEVVRDLVRRGAAVDARDEDGYTALMYAANVGDRAAVDELIAAEADVNARDDEGSTPLMFAAQGGFSDVVQRLLEAGADPSARGDHGLTARAFAEQNGHDEVARLLAEAER
jgi:ankyrin repeat protein